VLLLAELADGVNGALLELGCQIVGALFQLADFRGVLLFPGLLQRLFPGFDGGGSGG
jgi:hypothetical protein